MEKRFLVNFVKKRKNGHKADNKINPIHQRGIVRDSGKKKEKIAECAPAIKIYRQDNPVTVLGRTSHVLKSYHAVLVLCGDPDLAPGVDYEFIQKNTVDELAAKAMLRGNVIKEYFFQDMYPEVIDPRGEWVFSMEN